MPDVYFQVSKQQVFEANVLGWCIEWVRFTCKPPYHLSTQASF